MDLHAWNERLAEHFGALASERRDIPLFALEHGLAHAEVAALSELLRAHIRSSPPSREHALAWVVYAAEIGYGYAGDEYWQTFSAQTPGWTENGDRSWVRSAFVAFQRQFAAAKPSGPWAEQFSIIAWPITHAILPRDLQQQLARVLYELRHSYSSELFEEPQRLGDAIAARSWNASARFRNLVQAPALVGQIAAALLLQGRVGSKALLHPSTLKRIGDDVDRERRGRHWLHGARGAAEERARIHGLASGRQPWPAFLGREEARAEVVRLGIEPRLVLRPVEGAMWDVSIEIPDLSNLLFRFPQLRDSLADSRCVVAGAAGRPLARGRCLHGPQRTSLKRWPRPEEVLLKFERVEPHLEYLLHTECLLRPGTRWLFKVAGDGLAYESRGMKVRPSSTYLLVSTDPLARVEVAREVALSCEGVYALRLDLPDALTSEWENGLRELRVTQAKSIEVWPAGLAAAFWDGEGHGEWLSSERPTLAIRSDHAIDELTVSMGEGAASLTLTLEDTPAGEPVFIELPALHPGVHTFSVAARGQNGPDSEVIGDLDVVMHVRDARPWSPGVTSHGPLEVDIDPASPSIEQFWEGQAAVDVRGPEGRLVRCGVQMFSRGGGAPSFERELPSVTLPLSSKDWIGYFKRHLKADKSAQRAYDDAHLCKIEFSADELGAFTLRCEREFTPLRWSLGRHPEGFAARLHNDVGSESPEIARYAFEKPDVAERLGTAELHVAPRSGGLYVATHEPFVAAIIVPPVVRHLNDLQCNPRLGSVRRTAAAIESLLATARLWGTARLSADPFVGARRAVVIRAIASHILGVLCGPKWAAAESGLTGERLIAALKELVSNHRGTPPVGAELAHEFPEFATKPPPRRVAWLANQVERFQIVPRGRVERAVVRRSQTEGVTVLRGIRGAGPDDSAWLAEFALRLASDPAGLTAWAQEHTRAGIDKLIEVPTLARAARFLVIAVDHVTKSDGKVGDVYAGWEWSA